MEQRPILCCVECFSAEELRALVAESGTMGECAYCGAEGVEVTQPRELSDLFTPLFDYYEIVEYGKHFIDPDANPIDYGESLGYLLQHDWGIFSDRLDGTDRVNDLVEAITGVEARDLWATESDRWYVEPGEVGWTWRKLTEHLKNERRFFLDPSLSGIDDPRDWSIYLEEVEQSLGQGQNLWRSRLRGKSNEEDRIVPYPSEQMGAPPASPQLVGRGNPPGIRYLYTATDMETAVGEKRPGAGTILSVAKLRVLEDLVLVDLAAVRPPQTPFGHESIAHAITAYEVLTTLGRELTRPVHHEDPVTEYLPSQFLCELILDLGYDGVVYGSSYGSGKNVLLFDPDAAIPISVKLVRVQSLTFELDEGSYYEPDRDRLY